MSRLEGWAAKACAALVIVLVYVPVLLIAAPISLIGEGMMQFAKMLYAATAWLEEKIEERMGL